MMARTGRVSWRHFRDRIQRSDIARQLVGQGAVALAVKIGNIALGFAVATVLARALGPAHFGVYTLVLTIVSVLSIPAQFGLPRLLVRETARGQATKVWARVGGLWRWSTAITCAFALALALAAAGLALTWGDRFAAEHLHTFYWGLLLVPLMALGALRGAALQGLRRVVLGQLPEKVLRPGLFFLLLLVVTAGLAPVELGPSTAMALHAAAAACALAIGIWLVVRHRPQELAEVVRHEYATRTWLAAIAPLALGAGIHQINRHADILVLGAFVSATDVGLYKIAAQGAMLTGLGVQLVAMVISPYMAGMHARGDAKRMQKLVTLTARAGFAFAATSALTFAFAGPALLEAVFGEAYRGSYVPLLLLALGQVLNGLLGPVIALMQMTGHERQVAFALVLAAGANVALNLLLVPLFGLEGAAVATLASIAVWKLVLWDKARRLVSIDCAAIPLAALAGLARSGARGGRTRSL